MSSINLMLGDCLERMKDIPDGGVDMILCDPPYGTTACKWDSVIDLPLMWEQLKRVTKPTSAILLFGAEPFSSILRCSNLQMFKYDWVWEKPHGTGFLNAKKQPIRAHEVVSVFYNKPCTYNPQKTQGHVRKISTKRLDETEVYGKQVGEHSYDSTERFPRSVQVFSSDKQKSSLHPTQKPIALMEYLIKTYTTEGDSVLDFTMGSGTTGVACVNLGREFIGIEMDEGYFNIAEKRIADAQSLCQNVNDTSSTSCQ